MEESGIFFLFSSFIKLGSFTLRCIQIANLKLELVAYPASGFKSGGWSPPLENVHERGEPDKGSYYGGVY